MLIVISMSAAIAAGAILLLMMRPTPIGMDFADESE